MSEEQEQDTRGAPKGNDNAVGNNGGPPKGSANAETHSLTSDPGKYYERLSPEQQDRVDSWAESWRRRADYGTPGFDKMFQVHATKLHQIEAGDEYIADQGTIVDHVVGRTESGEPIVRKEENPAFKFQSRAVGDIMGFLKRMGCLNDPDSQQADVQRGIIARLSAEQDKIDAEKYDDAE